MDLKTILETENHDVTVSLCGKPYVISAERNIYNAVRAKYGAMAEAAELRFEEEFKKLKDIDELIEKVPDLFLEVCEEPLLEVVSDIISVDIYTVDKQTVIDKAFDGVYFDPFLKSYSEYDNTYNEIISELKGAEYAREQRKQNRARWQSATIGGNAITAWSNQLDAASMNAVEGIAHSIFNAIGNAMDRAEAKRNMIKLFENDELRTDLISSVDFSCRNLYKLLIEIVTKNTSLKIRNIFPSKNDQAKAEAMHNNLKEIKLSKEKQEEFIRIIFTLNPYDYDYYMSIIDMFGDAEKEIEKYGELHGMDMIWTKNGVLREFVKANLGKTEDDAHHCQELMNKRAEEIGLDNDKITSGRDIINDQLKKLDEEYRTVDDILFDTRDEADAAKKELEAIKTIMDTIEAPTSESTLAYENDLLEKKKKIEEMQTEIKDKYVKKTDDYLQDFDTLFCKVGYKTLTRKEAGIERALIFAKKLPVGNYDELDESIKKLKEHLPELGVDYEETTSTSEYFNSCEKKLNTVDGIQCSDRKEAEKARQELKTIQSIMDGVQPPTKESLLDYEQRLLKIRSQLEQLETLVKNKYINTINNHLVSFDKKFRMVSMLSSNEMTRTQAGAARALKYAQNLPVNNYSEMDTAVCKTREFLPLVGITEAEASSAFAYLNQCEAKLNTVDGVTLPNREEAAKARQELTTIASIMNGVQPPPKDALLDYEQLLLYKRSLLEQLTTVVKLKYINQINKYLTAFDENFRRVSLIKTCATREEAAKERALKFVKSKTYNTVADVNAARQALSVILPNLGITFQQADSAVKFLQSTEDKLNGVGGGSMFSGLFGKRKK